MDILTLCPFPAGTLLWEAQPGQFSLTVLVKATFALSPGEASVAPEQDPLCEDRHWDNNILASLHRPGDLVPAKRRVDVVLVGHAYAPGSAAVPSLVARVRVGDFVKAVRVTGDRLWTKRPGGLAPGAPAPFLRMPLRYERAPLSADNPVGIDESAPPAQGMHALPNLERVERAGVPCFGPVAPAWRGRRRLLDDAALFWAYGVAAQARPTDGSVRSPSPPIGAAPAGFNFEFFNAAPRDQQIELLRAGAPIVLEHLDPEHPRLETRLPPYRPQVFRIHPTTGRSEEIVVRADSLWIDCDRGVAVVTWRGLADVASPDPAHVGRLVIAADPDGKKLRFSHLSKQMGEDQVTTERFGARPEAADAEPPDPLAVRYDSVKSRSPAGGEIDAGSESITITRELPGSDDDRTQDIVQYMGKSQLPLRLQSMPDAGPRGGALGPPRVRRR